jgi:hypothetical protein
MRLPNFGANDVLVASVGIFIDGAPLFAGGYKSVRVTAQSVQAPAYYSMATLVPLSVGTHTISVQARGNGGNQDGVIGGDSGTLTNAGLSILMLKQ